MVEQENLIGNPGDFCYNGFQNGKGKKVNPACQSPQCHENADAGSCQADDLIVPRKRGMKKEKQAHKNAGKTLKIYMAVLRRGYTR